MTKPWFKNLRQIEPYVPGEQSKNENIIKLNANENPYPPSPQVMQALREIRPENLSLYPNSNAQKLVDAIAQYHGVKSSQVFVGNGSDDVIALSFMAFFNSDKPILFPDITYSFYPVWCRLFNIPYETPKVDDNFKIIPSDYYKPNGGVIFPNPNAPTGIGEGKEFIKDILNHNPDSIVIVDEAYIDFAGPSAVGLLERYENLLVVQTFSKSRSLAGLRIGFAMGHPRLIRALNDVKYSFNSYTMNMPSQLLGAASVGDEAYFQETVRRIRDTREKAKLRFRGLGFSFPDSQANFLFVTHPGLQARVLFEALKRERIYVRYFDAPRLDNFLRITIGTEQEMEKLFAFLEDFVKKEG